MKKPKRKLATRLGVVYGLCFLALTGVLFRMAYVQVTLGSQFRNMASNQQISYIPVLPPRGWIYDSNNQLIADDVPAMSIVLTRLHTKAQNFAQMAQLMAPVLGQSVQALQNTMENQNSFENQIYLVKNASDKQVSFVAENKSELPGINVEVSSQRNYVHNMLAGHLLGYVGALTPSDVPTYVNKDGYLLDQVIGKSGLESEYETYLQGKVGRDAIVINSLGIPIKSLGLSPPPTQGDTLHLTVDGHLQAITQQDLANMIHTMDTKQNLQVKNGAAVVIDVKTGGVLALTSYPYYDPNWFLNPKQLAQHAKSLNTFDYAIQGDFMPGSTVKPANMMLGLLEKIITPTTKVLDQGFLMIGTYKMHGDNPVGYGWVGPVETLEVSDDIFMYQLSLWLAHWPPVNMKVGTWMTTLRTQAVDQFHYMEQRFGLGVKTGIDLPGESTGYFTDTKQLYDLPATAIGQDQGFTPLQLANYAATIANSGVRYQPHLVASITSADGKLVKTFKPTVVTKIQAPAAYWNVLHQGMHLVADGSMGTASGSFMNAPYQSAGKTGTAQQGGGANDVSVYIGYAPLNNPQIAYAVVIPGGGYGATGAVPVAREIADAYFQEHHEFFPKKDWTGTSIGNP